MHKKSVEVVGSCSSKARVTILVTLETLTAVIQGSKPVSPETMGLHASEVTTAMHSVWTEKWTGEKSASEPRDDGSAQIYQRWTIFELKSEFTCK